MSDLEQSDVSVGEPRHVAAQAAAVGVLRGHGLALARGEEVVSVMHDNDDMHDIMIMIMAPVMHDAAAVIGGAVGEALCTLALQC